MTQVKLTIDGRQVIADDGKTIVVARRNKLFKFDGTKEHDDLEDSIIADDIVGFQMTPDAENIYILDDYYDLYYVQSPEKTVLLAESLVNPNFQYPAASMDYRGRLYFISDGELHYAVKDTVQTVEGFEGTPSEVFPSGSVIYFNEQVGKIFKKGCIYPIVVVSPYVFSYKRILQAAEELYKAGI